MVYKFFPLLQAIGSCYLLVALLSPCANAHSSPIGSNGEAFLRQPPNFSIVSIAPTKDGLPERRVGGGSR
jgi:hypothetical protein